MAVQATEKDYETLESQLCGESVPLAQRFRALFTLKNLANQRSIEIIGKAFKHSSALLGHELAYVLGQIHDPVALPILKGVLEDTNQHPMVRHEAAEAMGAIGDKISLEILRKYRDDPNENISVRETCELALDKIEYDNQISDKEKEEASKFDSIDPAPPLSMHGTENVPGLESPDDIAKMRELLLDSNASLFKRYRAMFALRNDGSKDAVLALAEGFGDSSALFRHEIAYVFGQLCSPHSVPALIKALDDKQEDEMVRHEAAEALGSIATPECMPVLERFKTEGPRVVRESCEVALDMYEYENSGQFQYATPLGATA